MLLYLIPSVTLQLHSLSISYGDVDASQSLMQPSLRSTTLVYLCLSCNHLGISHATTFAPSTHVLMCTLSFYALVTLPCYLTIALTFHSFCAHTVTPSHDSLSPFLTQLSVPVPISHTIFSPSRYLALPISRAISIALSLSDSHMYTGRGRTWRMAVHKAMRRLRPCLWSVLAKV